MYAPEGEVISFLDSTHREWVLDVGPAAAKPGHMDASTRQLGGGLSPQAGLAGSRTGPRHGGTPVVLLHSAGLDHTYWDRQAEVLSATRDTVALDLPGHGGSPADPTDINLGDVTDRVAAAVAALGAGPVNLVGLSVGGLVAQQVALEHPALVATLTLVDTAASFSAAGQRMMRGRAEVARTRGMSAVLDGLLGHWLMPATVSARPDLVDRITATVLGDDPDVHAALWEMVADFTSVSRLADIAVPTLVVVGEHDSSSPVTSSVVLRDGIPGARMSVVAGAAHLSPLDRPDEVTRLLAEFLDDLPAARVG